MRTRDEILNEYDLTDRVAIVTGGSRGIGLAIAQTFAAMGASVGISSRKADACAEAAAEIEATGGNAFGFAAHAGRVDELSGLVDATVERFGRIDIIVNNAANALAMPIGSITAEAWESSYGVNLRGPLFLVQHALPYLQQSPCATIVNVISAGAFTHGTYLAMYCSAKAALMQLTRAMAAEFAPMGIRANALAPGTTDTDMVRNNTPEMQQAMTNAGLIKRMATREELADAALYLASDASSFMTGQVLVVDGGMTTH